MDFDLDRFPKSAKFGSHLAAVQNPSTFGCNLDWPKGPKITLSAPQVKILGDFLAHPRAKRAQHSHLFAREAKKGLKNSLTLTSL